MVEMIKIIKAEHIKTRKSASRHILWLFPIVTFILAAILTLGTTDTYAQCVWNWWYTMILPGVMAIICYLSIIREKKIGFYNLLTFTTESSKLFLGKIIYIALMILVSNLIIFAGAAIGGFIFTSTVPVLGGFIASILLTVTLLWQIPILLLISEKFGLIVEVIFSMFLAFSGTIISQTGKWLLVPFAIPMRIMCPLIHVLPNGLRAEIGNEMMRTADVFLGVIVSLVCLLIIGILVLFFSKDWSASK